MYSQSFLSIMGVDVGVGVALGVGLALGVAVAAGAACLIATPLFHTNFLPDLTQVYLIPAEVLVCPSLEQEVPGFTAAVATGSSETKTSITASSASSLLRIHKL